MTTSVTQALGCSPQQLLAVMASRQLEGVSSVFAGVGVPLLAAALAQSTHSARPDNRGGGRLYWVGAQAGASAHLHQ